MNPDVPTVTVFVALIVVTLAITAWASRRNKDVSHHYAAGGEIKGWQNGLAITSDFISAATLLGVVGLLALGSFTGFYIGVGGVFALLMVLLLVAEPMRNLGRYTLADALTSRFGDKGLRSTTALSTVAISIPYMIVQLVGAGVIIELLLGVDDTVAVLVIGVLMAIYITAGGMLATTWIQIVQAVVIISAVLVMAVLVLARFSFNPLGVFTEAAAELGSGALTPPHGLTGLDWTSFIVAQVLGIAGMPHILIRFFTVPDAKTARSSAAFAVWATVIVMLTMPILGYGAALLVGQDTIAEAGEGGNLAAPLLAGVLGGQFLLAFIAAAVFAAILSTVVGLVIASSGAFAHDFYNSVFRRGEAGEREQLNAARLMGLLVSVLSIGLSLAVQNVNIAILVAVPLVIAASANFPVIMLTLYWRRFTSAGAVIGMLVGLAASLGLVLLSPTVMGDDAIFPLQFPAIVSVPIGFLGCYLGSLLTRGRGPGSSVADGRRAFDEMRVRANIGATTENSHIS